MSSTDVTTAGRQVLVDTTDDGVRTITFHNPERRNAWNPTMESQYFAALDDAAADEAVRAIVVTGTGSSFCPGLDSQRLEQAAGPVGLRLEGRRSQHYPLTIPKPMVAAINGACAGIGLVQALVCDVRFMARDARLSTAYAKLGLPFREALAVAATVISQGEANGRRYLVADCGLKALGMDHGLPDVELADGTPAKVWFCSDEHVTFAVPGDAPTAATPARGELVAVRPAHVDPTVAYHERYVLVRSGSVVDEWPIDLRGW